MEIDAPVDGTNTRAFLWAYAAMAVVGGYLLLANPWPLRDLLNRSANGSYSLIFVCGTMLFGSALTAVGLSTIPGVLQRRHVLGWFIAAHALVLCMLFIQWKAVWPWGLADWLLGAAALVTLALLYAWSTALGDPSWWTTRPLSVLHQNASTASSVRAQYEQQIRLAAAQEERHRLARDLHDSVKQQLFAIQTAAATAQTKLESDGPGASEALEVVRSSAREAMVEMDVVTDQLRAAPLENGGLMAALRKQADALRFRTGASVELTIGELPASTSLPPGTHDALFRAAQEACSNIARHARATRVKIDLEAFGNDIRLTIADDGVGLDSQHARQAGGIHNMRSRAVELGGRCEIRLASLGGTIVVFAVPFEVVVPGHYLNKAVTVALGMALLGTMMLVLGSRSGHIKWELSPLLLFPALELVRYLLAWRRANHLQSAGA